jgi:hypothetical protein
MSFLTRTIVLAVGLSMTAPGAIAAQAFPSLPSEAEAAEVRATLAAMKAGDRGPYERIRWFCNDGTVQPPQAGACT